VYDSTMGLACQEVIRLFWLKYGTAVGGDLFHRLRHKDMTMRLEINGVKNFSCRARMRPINRPMKTP
jgi:hypothetical protein